MEVSTEISEDIETDFPSILVGRGRSRGRERPGRGRRGGARQKHQTILGRQTRVSILSVSFLRMYPLVQKIFLTALHLIVVQLNIFLCSGILPSGICF